MAWEEDEDFRSLPGQKEQGQTAPKSLSRLCSTALAITRR